MSRYLTFKWEMLRVATLNETDGDRHLGYNKKKTGVVFRERSSGASFQYLHEEVWITVDKLLYLQHHLPPPWHIRTPNASPRNDLQHPPEQSYTPLWSSLSLTLVLFKKKLQHQQRSKMQLTPTA